MNASYFVFLAALLSFATGFFVATIIWMISWMLSPKDTKAMTVHFRHFLQSIFGTTYHDYIEIFGIHNSKISYNNDTINEELYQYHHGEN